MSDLAMSDFATAWVRFSASEQMGESIALGCIMLASFMSGVIYAAYRAIGWETKLRAWAHGLDLGELESLATESSTKLDEALDVLLEEVNETEKSS